MEQRMMHGPQFRLSLAAAVLAAALQGCTGSANEELQTNEADRPNVLFIAVDDMNDWISPLDGYPGTVHTPNLERLAQRGMTFTNAHVPAVSCNPSRAALLTGVRPSTSGVYDLRTLWYETPALRDVATLPAHFRANGYRTLGTGKIFHALSWLNGSYGVDQNDVNAWDEFYPSLTQQMPDARFPEGTERTVDEEGYWLYEWERVAAGSGERPDIQVPYYMDWAPFPDGPPFPDEQVTSWAVDQLGRNHDEPIFLAVGIFRPHIPWFAPQRFFDLYPLDEILLPEPGDWREGLPEAGQRMGQERRMWHQWIEANDEWPTAVQGYLASISFADAQVGRLLDALEASGKADHTIVVLWSDHGFQLGERETWEKFTLWEESTRVPFFVVAPGQVAMGGSSPRAVDLMDIYPTLLELAGLPSPSHELEGASLMPWLQDPTLPRERPAISTAASGQHTVRTDRWRYIRYRDGSEELYDHDVDPEERVNLAGDAIYADTVAALARWLEPILADEAERDPGGA
jgi:arylsulfatase A-like enzyme